MTKAPKKEIEFYPDAMQRFERAVSVVAKSPPQHRVAKSPKAKTARKGRKNPTKG
jgi:hypothetical protein